MNIAITAATDTAMGIKSYLEYYPERMMPVTRSCVLQGLWFEGDSQAGGWWHGENLER